MSFSRQKFDSENVGCPTTLDNVGRFGVTEWNILTAINFRFNVVDSILEVPWIDPHHVFSCCYVSPSSRTVLCSPPSPNVRSDAPRGDFCQRHCPACYRWDPGSIPGQFMCYKSGTGADFFRIFMFSRVSFHQPSKYLRRCLILTVHPVVLYNTPVSRF